MDHAEIHRRLFTFLITQGRAIASFWKFSNARRQAIHASYPITLTVESGRISAFSNTYSSYGFLLQSGRLMKRHGNLSLPPNSFKNMYTSRLRSLTERKIRPGLSRALLNCGLRPGSTCPIKSEGLLVMFSLMLSCKDGEGICEERSCLPKALLPTFLKTQSVRMTEVPSAL